MRIVSVLLVALAITITGCDNAKKRHIEDDPEADANNTPASDTHKADLKPAFMELYATYTMSEITPAILQISNDTAITAMSPNGQSIAEICKINDGYYAGPDILTCHESDTVTVNHILASPQAKAYLPDDFRPIWSLHPTYGGPGQHHFSLIGLKTVNGSPELDYRALESAYADTDPTMGNTVTIKMNLQGAKMWQQITKNNIGRPIAIVIDGRVYSAPTVNCAIEGGRSTITGNFNEAEAQLLAERIQASVGAMNNTDSRPLLHDKRRHQP